MKTTARLQPKHQYKTQSRRAKRSRAILAPLLASLPLFRFLSRLMLLARVFPPLLLLLLLLAATTTLSCSREWIEFRGNSGLGSAQASLSPPIAVKWKLLLQKQDEDRRYFNQPLLKDETIYFGSADGNFYSLDLRTGFMNWNFRSEGPINSVAFIDRNAVYFGSTDGRIYALSRQNGDLLWQFQTGGQVNSTIIPYEDMIVAASDADAMYFLNKAGGLEFTLNNSSWHRVAFQIFDDILAFAPGPPDNPSSLSLYDLQSERYLWGLGAELGQYYWYSFPAVRGRRLHFSATGLVEPGIWQHYFASYNLYTGELLWEETDEAILGTELPSLETSADYLIRNSLLLDYAAPLLWRNQVIYAMGDQVLRSYNARTGREMWKRIYQMPISAAPTLAGDRLYIGLEAREGTGQLLSVSPSSGAVQWSIDIDGAILNSPVIAGPWIIFGTDEGFFYVLEEVL